MPKITLKLQPKQETLLEALKQTGPDAITRWGFGGARGGGKSAAIRFIAMVLAMEFPGIVVVLVRKHLGDLMENHVEKMRLEQPEFHKRYYRVSDYEWRLDNGSRITLAYGDTAQDVQEFSRGPEFTFLLVDQAEQFTEQELVWLTIPNRWPGAKQRFAKSAFFFNPGGPGTEFLRRVFHKRDFKVNENPKDWAFIQAYGWDNYEWFRGEVPVSIEDFYAIPGEPTNLDSEALSTFCHATWPNCSCKTRFQIFVNHTSEGHKMRALDASKRLGELFGSFEKFSGQYYASVWDEETCVISASQAQALIQPWWVQWIAQDWGFAHHNANLWAATGKLSPQNADILGIQTDWPIDVIVVHRELVVSETGEEDLAREIVRMTPKDERKYIGAYYIGKDAWQKRGAHDSVADQLSAVFALNQIPLPQPANDDRVAGWRMLHNCFQRNQWRKGAPVERDAVKTGPILLISANCPEVISAVPLLIRKEDKLEDVQKTDSIGDNVGDCLRYLIHSHLDPRSKAPREVRAREVYESHSDPTSRAIAMKKFSVGERKRLAKRSRWR